MTHPQNISVKKLRLGLVRCCTILHDAPDAYDADIEIVNCLSDVLLWMVDKILFHRLIFAAMMTLDSGSFNLLVVPPLSCNSLIRHWPGGHRDMTYTQKTLK